MVYKEANFKHKILQELPETNNDILKSLKSTGKDR